MSQKIKLNLPIYLKKYAEKVLFEGKDYFLVRKVIWTSEPVHRILLAKKFDKSLPFIWVKMRHANDIAAQYALLNWIEDQFWQHFELFMLFQTSINGEKHELAIEGFRLLYDLTEDDMSQEVIRKRWFRIRNKTHNKAILKSNRLKFKRLPKKSRPKKAQKRKVYLDSQIILFEKWAKKEPS